MKNSIKILIGLALAVITSQAQALVIITPDTIDGAACTTTTCWTSDVRNTLSITEITDLIGYSGTDPLVELYKSDVNKETDPIGSSDSGFYAPYYDTSFTKAGSPSNDPDSALIEYVGTPDDPFINCPDCFVLVKDGSQTPNQYIFDISSWDGLMDIQLNNFFPDQGAISHIAIYGAQGTNVPEPGMVGLLSIGLLGMVVARRKMKV